MQKKHKLILNIVSQKFILNFKNEFQSFKYSLIANNLFDSNGLGKYCAILI